MKRKEVRKQLKRIIIPIFPLFWKKCAICGEEFRFEKGWHVMQQYYEYAYWINRIIFGHVHICKDCAPTKEALIQTNFRVDRDEVGEDILGVRYIKNWHIPASSLKKT